MKEIDNDRRRHSVEEKVHQTGQQSPAASIRCERFLGYFKNLGVTLPGSRLLDLGCSVGRLTIELAERGYDTYGIDINADYIEVARNKAKDMGVKANFTTSPGEQLPYDDSFFDICIVFDVLEHVTDWKKTISEVARVLKPGGVALFETGNALYPLPGEVKHVPCLGYFPYRVRKRIIDMIAARFPSLISYTITPAYYWFTQTGLRKKLFSVGFNRSWDVFDLIDVKELSPKYRFVSWLLPLIKKLPYPYLRDIAHFPRRSVMLVVQKA